MIVIELSWREVTLLHHLIALLRREWRSHPKQLSAAKRMLNALELRQLNDRLIRAVREQKLCE